MKLLAVAALALSASLCRADIVTLKDGRWVEGKLVSSGGTVKIKTSAGVLSYKRSEVAKIKRRAYKAPDPQPWDTNFGSEFGTRPRPKARDYTLASKPRPTGPMSPVRQPERPKKTRR